MGVVGMRAPARQNRPHLPLHLHMYAYGPMRARPGRAHTTDSAVSEYTKVPCQNMMPWCASALCNLGNGCADASDPHLHAGYTSAHMRTPNTSSLLVQRSRSMRLEYME